MKATQIFVNIITKGPHYCSHGLLTQALSQQMATTKQTKSNDAAHYNMMDVDYSPLVSILRRDNFRTTLHESFIFHRIGGHEIWITWLDFDVFCSGTGPRLNIKTVLSTFGDFHVKDKTAVGTSYL